MRIVNYTSRFKRDYRREKSGRHGKKLDTLLMEVVDMLAEDTPLPRRALDHRLTGEWSDHRDCHIRPDLVLIYRKRGKEGEPHRSIARSYKISQPTFSGVGI